MFLKLKKIKEIAFLSYLNMYYLVIFIRCYYQCSRIWLKNKAILVYEVYLWINSKFLPNTMLKVVQIFKIRKIYIIFKVGAALWLLYLITIWEYLISALLALLFHREQAETHCTGCEPLQLSDFFSIRVFDDVIGFLLKTFLFFWLDLKD